jgi:hypothetical protein
MGDARERNQQLLDDWELRMRGAPDDPEGSGWAYNWDSAKCSTSQPTARSDDQGYSYATMFMTCCRTYDPVFDFTDFLNQLSQLPDYRAVKKKFLVIADNGPPLERGKRAVTVITNHSDEVLLRGSITLNNGREFTGDANTGFYAQLQAVTEIGTILMQVMEAVVVNQHGHCCIIFHDRVEFDLGDGRMLVRVSGFGPDDTNTATSSNNELATRFTIRENGTDVARCHLSYHDASADPSMGPTIEMMAVHKDHRGKNLLPVLWYWVRCFIEEKCTLECMNSDFQPGLVMVKATRLINAEIERKRKDGKPITDKDFFYDYAGFSVREQKGYIRVLESTTRPRDEEAVLYIPLLSKQQIKDRTKYKDFRDIEWPSIKGARCCYNCNKVWIGHLHCAKCKVASYCTRSCQEQDWKRHKKWCGKTKDQVHTVLVERGLRVPQLDGTYATARGMRSMSAEMR